MIRVIRGHTACKLRKKICLFASTFRGTHSRFTRTTIQKKIKALVFSHQDNSKKKRDFRRLWIPRINSVTRFSRISKNKIFHSYSYSYLIQNMYKNQLFLNRKILAQIAISNRNCFDTIFKKIIK
uniref:50S ribosomal protein L20 n=1 Tax=Burmannia itoana TaxID=396654 RepID=A0A5B9T551_9LILI|nr:ribosomal protein L20 [Burmannia itoana]